MIQDGPRELIIPGWLWAAVPLASIVWVGIDVVWHPAQMSDARSPERIFFDIAVRLATTWLAAFLVIDIAVRARTPWYALPLLFVAAWLVAIFAVSDVLAGSIRWLADAIGSAAVASGGGFGGGRGGGPAVWVMLVVMLVALLALAILPALIVTLSGRILAGSPVVERDAFGELRANLLVIVLWLLLTTAGYLVLLFYLNVWRSVNDKLTPVLVTGGAALVAAFVQLNLMRQRRRGSELASSRVNIWAVSALCVLAIVFKPELFGSVGVSLSRDYVRPALRAIGLSPSRNL